MTTLYKQDNHGVWQPDRDADIPDSDSGAIVAEHNGITIANARKGISWSAWINYGLGWWTPRNEGERFANGTETYIVRDGVWVRYQG